MWNHIEQMRRKMTRNMTRMATAKEDGDCGEKDFPRGKEGVTTLVGTRLATSSAFLISSQPPNPQVPPPPPPVQLKRPFHHWHWRLSLVKPSFRLLTSPRCHHHSGISQVMILYWPHCSRLHHCTGTRVQLHTEHWTLHTRHCTRHAQCACATARCTPQILHFTMQTATAHCTQHIEHGLLTLACAPLYKPVN